VSGGVTFTSFIRKKAKTLTQQKKMRSRIYTFLLLFFALAMLNTSQAKADDKGKPNAPKDNKKDNSSDKNLPINTAIGALLVAGVGIGVMAIKKAKSVNKAI
jgi:hypothetical protein